MPEPLFNKASNKTIFAYDLFGKKHKRKLNQFKFRVSAYGILKKGDKILLQRNPLIKEFSLPGGGIELGETIEKGLAREYGEETGLKVKPKKLLAVTEDFFTYGNENAHSVLIFYEVEKISGTLATNDEDSAEVKYIETKNLTKKTVQRVFWKVIKSLK